ncbi:AAA family ATPase [Histophilus somni]|uniref:AAA family ATPase n=1 Tax=Histophilus somni TaxID=731 RepID=UPI00201FA9DC|nr:AAA family ATPase [Histophilus somni]
MQISLSQQIVDYIQARYTAFYLKTAETERANHLIKSVAEQLNLTVLEYNLACGKIDFHNKSTISDNAGRMEQSFKDLLDEDLENTLIFIRNAKTALEHNPLAISRLQHLIEMIERHNLLSAIILQSAETFIPADIEPYITLLELPLPTENEIKSLIRKIESKIDESLLNRLSTALSGLNELEIQKLLHLVQNRFKHISEHNQTAILAEIQNQKEQIIAKSGVLEMVKVTNTIDDIGGLENLKKWLKEQSDILNNLDEALQFGVKAPKGTLIAGMPGCGKSLTAKAAATLFQQPLLRLDIGSLLGKYVGESENNMRKALAMAESISPCVLWVDELEKAFVGMTGNNASEVSSRLLGYFLTWVQEKTKPVFIVATANDVTALPPELLRKGRFDEIFYVGFPNNKERKQILAIHLNKAKQDKDKFDLAALARLCKDYSGADIENAVYDAVKTAFLSKEKQLTQHLLTQAIEKTVPLRKTLKDKVGEYEEKFESLHLTPASANDGLTIPQMIKMAKDPNYLERIKVAESDEVTEDILADLVNDEKIEVRKAVFSNPNCTAKLLNKQLQRVDGDKLYNKELFHIIVKHKNVSDNLVWSIFNSNESIKSEFLKSFLKKKNISIETQKSLAEDSYSSVRRTLATYPHLAEEVQLMLVKDSDWDIRQNLIENNHIILSNEIQKLLAKDSDSGVRRCLAKYPHLAEEVQLMLAKDSDWDVRRGVTETS